MLRTCLITLLLLTACAGNQPNDSAAVAKIIATAIADPTRSEEAGVRDDQRKPAQVLTFAGTKPGHTVVEIAPGGGYYTALLSRVVGARGHVYAVDPERIFEYFPQGRDGFKQFAAQDPQDNVTYSSQLLDQIVVPSGVDQVWMVLYYHDTLWTGEDRAAMNRRLYQALKPGGVYLVIDHRGVTGSGAERAKQLHRMDASIALQEIQAAGFVLDQRSAMLGNASDPRDDSVFSPERRGNTDRFVWRFVKPG